MQSVGPQDLESAHNPCDLVISAHNPCDLLNKNAGHKRHGWGLGFPGLRSEENHEGKEEEEEGGATMG